MYCKKCGSQLTDGAKFCKNCGEKVSENKRNNPIVHQEYRSQLTPTHVADKKTNTKKGVLIVLAVLCLVGAGGFGIWKYVQSHRILLLTKITEYNRDGEETDTTYKYKSIQKKNNGEIEVTGQQISKDEYGEITHVQFKDIYRKDHTLKISEFYDDSADFKTVYTYNELGNPIKGESITDYHTYTIIYDDYGILKKSCIDDQEVNYEIKYSGEDSKGNPTKATILDDNGDVNIEYELNNGKIVTEKTYDCDYDAFPHYEITENKYDKKGNLLERKYYPEEELGYKQVYEYETHKIK